MTRCARERRVFFFEEAVVDLKAGSRLSVEKSGQVTVLTPHVPVKSEPVAIERAVTRLLSDFMRDERVWHYVAWYYTPMALSVSDHLRPIATIYDCMDELSAFKGASPLIKERETELMRRADLVLTGGHSLYEAKRHLHPNIHPFPSSVDVAHFAQARHATAEPASQAAIPRPRLGFFGVIDERMDLALIDAVAAARPDWHIVMIGPIVKIDSASVPNRSNIHYLGPKQYDELPGYLAGWNVALLPFARNEATRFISPTKTPEYMAAGVPVVSTSIRDVVRPYGQDGLVRIADQPEAFIDACADAMAESAPMRLARNDAFLRHTSWDATWESIRHLVDTVIDDRDATTEPVEARTSV